jgi:hypothetical protein
MGLSGWLRDKKRPGAGPVAFYMDRNMIKPRINPGK